MKEVTELEEGEAFCNQDDDDDDVDVDLDSLSYIDERLQLVLGHFQKDFEGGVSAENLGARFGGYGSFLPTYECSPRSLSHPKNPQRNQCSPKSPANLHMEAASRNTKAPSIMPCSTRLGTAPQAFHSFNNLRAPSLDDSMKKDRGVSSSEVAERSNFKDDSTKKSGNSTEKTLKFRIKMKSNIIAKRNAEIYSGLGLDDSPSSMGNSPMDSEGMQPVSQENTEDSPTAIIQVMTSFPIPGGVLTSPLHENLLYLVKKEKIFGESRYMSSLSAHQQPCSMSTDESDSVVGDGHPKKRKVRIVRKSGKRLELKHVNGTLSENDIRLHSKKKLGNLTPDRKDFVSDDLKCTPLSSSICDAGETAEVNGKASEVCKEVNKGMSGRMVSAEAVKEESLESISGRDIVNTEKQNAGYGYKKIFEHKLENSHKDDSIDPKNNNEGNTYIISTNIECGAVKGKLDPDPQKCETIQKAKAIFEGNVKSKGDQSPGKAETVARKDGSRSTNYAQVTEKQSTSFGIASCKSKMNKPKSLKDHKVRDSGRYSSKGKKSEWKVGGPLGNGAIKNVNIGNLEEQSASGDKVKERPSGNKVVNNLPDEPHIKDASGSFPMADNIPASEMIPSIGATPQVIAEDWVCCDKCGKWRLLPTGMKPEQLPEKWLCSMLNWLTGMNRCDISEEETTKALYALYQLPIPEGQNNIHINATGTAVGVRSNDASQFDLNNKNSNAHQRKKKYVIKEKAKEGINNDMLQSSNSSKINTQESGKNRRLIGMNQHPAGSNLTKMSSKHLGRLDNLIEERRVPHEKEKQINKGEIKNIKLKRKMEGDQHRTGTLKKSKTEYICYADEQLNSGMVLEKVGLNSRNGFPTKTSRKDMQKYDEYCLSEDAHDKSLVSTKKGDQAVLSSGGESFDVKNSSKHDGSIKKRKMRDWMYNEQHCNSFSLQDNKQCGGEGNTNGFTKEKKLGILNTESKSATAGDDKLNKGRIMQAAVQIDKSLKPNTHRSHQVLDVTSALGKDLGTGQLSLAATSSSSKVSGSHKAKTNYEDIIGSPVESVTSSPLRTTKLDKRILSVGDISRKDDVANVGLSAIGSRRSVDNRKGRLSLKLKGDRILRNSNPVSDKFSSIEYRVKDAKDEPRVHAKTSEDDLLEVVAVEQHGNFANSMHHEDKVNKNKQENEFSWPKSGKDASLHLKEKERRSGSQGDADNIKVAYSKNDGRHDSAVDPSYCASGPETRNDARYGSPKSKREIDNISQNYALKHGSNEAGKQSEPKQKYVENSVLKTDVQCNIGSKSISQLNLTQDFEEENNANPVCIELGDGKSKNLSSAVGEVKREALYGGPKTAPGFQKGDMSTEHPVHVSSNGDVTKLKRKPVDASRNVGVNHSSGTLHPDQRLSVPSPMRTNSSQTDALNTLEEATKIKDRADNYKNSGFEFESNETYFEAALKFLHGASLLENSYSDSSKHGEMNHMQFYATAAKLFKSCAYGYERRGEMAAASLAYKCIEVAYMRVVNCKHSSTSRDRHELQSVLQMASQGESPSSSASDVDNLNNQAVADKGTLVVKGINSNVAGNQVLPARTQSNVVRLLDVVQDVGFAMEASKKCQSTFEAANVTMEEARNRDCIASVKRVVDFSFQDVDGLVRLVWIANKAISSAGLGGSRD